MLTPYSAKVHKRVFLYKRAKVGKKYLVKEDDINEHYFQKAFLRVRLLPMAGCLLHFGTRLSICPKVFAGVVLKRIEISVMIIADKGVVGAFSVVMPKYWMHSWYYLK